MLQITSKRGSVRRSIGPLRRLIFVGFGVLWSTAWPALALVIFRLIVIAANKILSSRPSFIMRRDLPLPRSFAGGPDADLGQNHCPLYLENWANLMLVETADRCKEISSSLEGRGMTSSLSDTATGLRNEKNASFTTLGKASKAFILLM